MGDKSRNDRSTLNGVTNVRDTESSQLSDGNTNSNITGSDAIGTTDKALVASLPGASAFFTRNLETRQKVDEESPPSSSNSDNFLARAGLNPFGDN